MNMFLFADYVRLLIEVSPDLARQTAKQLDIDFSNEKFTFDAFVEGMRVEMEHKDVTHGDPTMTAKIALAHLREKPDYYTLLSKLEKQ